MKGGEINVSGNLAAISTAIDIQSSGDSVPTNGRGQSDFSGILEGAMTQRRQAGESGSEQMNQSMQGDQASKGNFLGVAMTLQNLLTHLESAAQAIANPSGQGIDASSMEQMWTGLRNQLNDAEQAQLPTDLLKQPQLFISNMDQFMKKLLQVSKGAQTTLTDDSGQELLMRDPEQGLVIDPSIGKLLKEQDTKLLAELQAASGAILPQLNQALSLVGNSTDIIPRQVASILQANGQQQTNGLSSLVMQSEGVGLENGDNPSIDKALGTQIAQTMISGKSFDTMPVMGARNAAKGQQNDQDDAMASSKQPFFTPGAMNKVQQFVLHVGKTAQPDVSQQIVDQVKSVISSGNLKTFLDGNMQLTVKLHPANLGSVNVTLLQTDDGLLATITTHSGATKDIVESQLSQLKHALISAGVNVQKIDVAQATQPQQSDAQQQQGDNRQQHSFGGQQHQEHGDSEHNGPFYIDKENDEDFIVSLNESLMAGSESIEY